MLQQELTASNEELAATKHKWELANFNFNSLLKETLGKGRSEKAIQCQVLETKPGSHLSSLLEFPHKAPTNMININTQNESENDEVLIGTDTPDKDSRVETDLKTSIKNLTSSYANDNISKPHVLLPLVAMSQFESLSTENFVQKYTSPKLDISELKYSDQIMDFREQLEQRNEDILHLQKVVKILFVKSINSVKDAREAIGVILNFLSILESVRCCEFSEYLEHLKKSLRDQRSHFVSKLEYLRTEIEDIHRLYRKRRA